MRLRKKAFGKTIQKIIQPPYRQIINDATKIMEHSQWSFLTVN